MGRRYNGHTHTHTTTNTNKHTQQTQTTNPDNKPTQQIQTTNPHNKPTQQTHALVHLHVQVVLTTKLVGAEEENERLQQLLKRRDAIMGV